MVDLTSEYQAVLTASEAKAAKLLNEENYTAAAAEMKRCAHVLRQLAKGTRSQQVRAGRLARAERFETQGAELESGRRTPAGSTGARPIRGGPAAPEDDLSGRVLGLITETTVSWSDIVGLADAKSQLRSLFGIALAAKPEGLLVEDRPNVLLYGPPGTGKTLLAAAASHGLDATFFSVKAGDLLSKFFGESPQLVGELFAAAVARSPSLVFIDEVDSLTPDRSGDAGASGAESRVLAQLLAELDGIGTKSADSLVITIAATNTPWLLDDAILSRFSRQVYVPLPERDTRTEMFKLNIEGRGYRSEVDYGSLADRCAGLSGREIAQACGEAARMMLVRANPDLDEVVDRGADAIRAYELVSEPITRQEYEQALASIRPVANQAMLERYKDWGRAR